MSELIEQGGGVEEFLKTIRNSHYLLLFSSVALVLLSYSSYLTRIYQGAYDEIIGFEKIAVRRYFETKGWDFQVGGPKTSYGIPKLSSMPKTVRKVMERQNIFTFDEKKVLLEVDDEYKKMAREAMRNAGVGFAEGMDFSKQGFLPFSEDPRTSKRPTDTMTLQEIYDILNSSVARKPVSLFIPDEDEFRNAISEIMQYYKGKMFRIGAFYFYEVEPSFDPKTAEPALLGSLMTCSVGLVPAQEPRRCLIDQPSGDGIFAGNSMLGTQVPVIGTSLQDWIVNQDISAQFSIKAKGALLKLEYFPKLRLIWSEVRFMTIDKAKAYLGERRATYAQELPVEGLKVPGQSALVFGPLLLLSLLIILSSHLRHLRSMSGTLPEFPWIGLYNGKFDKFFTAGSIVLMPVAACILEAMSFSYFTGLIWICACCTPLLLYFGVSSVRDLAGIRERRDVLARKVSRSAVKKKREQ